MIEDKVFPLEELISSAKWVRGAGWRTAGVGSSREIPADKQRYNHGVTWVMCRSVLRMKR